MKVLNQEHHITAPLNKVWDALINPETINKWGGGPAKIDPKEGSNFSLWGGDVKGKNTKVVSPLLLEQDWMSGNWDEYSKVKFKLTFKDGCTTVYLAQTGIPDDELDDIANGWKTFYFDPIKKLLEQ